MGGSASFDECMNCTVLRCFNNPNKNVGSTAQVKLLE
jgi:hypothetical protein